MDLTIASFEVFKVAPRWVFLRVNTEDGIVGWGEPNLEGFSECVVETVSNLMKDSVIGERADRAAYIIAKLRRQKFYGTTSGPIICSAIAGIDQALMDINGKALKCPVHRLIGGAVRDRLKVYRWFGGDNNEPEDAAAEAARIIATSNFKQLKMNACGKMAFIAGESVLDAAEKRMAAVRAAVGPDIGIGLDFHGRVKVPTAKQLVSRLDKYKPLFFEEPVAESQNAYLDHVAASTPTPLATGERMYSLAQFRDLLERRSVHIIQPDCSHAGGISELVKIARMAEAYEVCLAPHCPLGPIALASCLHVDATCVNFAFQEMSLGIHYNSEGESAGEPLLGYLNNPEVFDVDVDGYVQLLSGPGLGVDINEAAVRNAAKRGHQWRDREWVLQDGTPTTW